MRFYIVFLTFMHRCKKRFTFFLFLSLFLRFLTFFQRFFIMKNVSNKFNEKPFWMIQCIVCYNAFLLSTYILRSVCHREKMRTGSINGVLRANTNTTVIHYIANAKRSVLNDWDRVKTCMWRAFKWEIDVTCLSRFKRLQKFFYVFLRF